MAALADFAPRVSSLVIAALLFCARRFLRELHLPCPTVKQIVEATDVTRSRAYELAAILLDLLPTLQRRPGRPPSSPAPSVNDPLAELSRRVLRYVLAHPGCAYGDVRQHYSDGFRHFIVELCQQHRAVDVESFAVACCLPLGTVKDWLRQGERFKASAGRPRQEPSDANQRGGDDANQRGGMSTLHIETVLSAWKNWQGSFTAFCEHVQHAWRIPFRRTMIARILDTYGVRLPKRRPGRSPDELALRGSFETFFAGAQWVGDGTSIQVAIDDHVFNFNLELMVDTYSCAYVGASIRPEEDSAAVTEAFTDGVQSVGGQPLCLLLDNKPSNHVGQVNEAIKPTIVMRATENRPQNKGHAEGAFGLFKQTAPPLTLTVIGMPIREIARQLLGVVFQTWARAVNRRPRGDRNGQTRVELYRDSQPSEKQIAAAKTSLRERARKQELARQTWQARQDPVVRRTLDEAFNRLGLSDPKRYVRDAIARYPLTTITNGLAIFEGKQKAGSLPAGVDARYLLGIVKNVNNKDEGIAIATELIRQRIAARDFILDALVHSCDHLCATTDSAQLPFVFVDRAFDTERIIDRLFWLNAAADAIEKITQDDVIAVFDSVSRKIHSAFRVPYSDRLDAIRLIANKLVVL